MIIQRKGKIVAAAVISVVTVSAVTSYALAATGNDAPGGTPSSQKSDQAAQTAPSTASDDQDGAPTNEQGEGQGSDDMNKTTVTVNGEEISVPENGTYSKSTRDGNSQTDVNVTSQNSSTSTGDSTSNSSSVKLNVTTESRSSTSQ